MRKNGNNLILSDFPGGKGPAHALDSRNRHTSARCGYLMGVGMGLGKMVAEARKHLGMVEQPSKRMFYAMMPPLPDHLHHPQCYELHALSSQVANLSVIILKAKET